MDAGLAWGIVGGIAVNAAVVGFSYGKLVQKVKGLTNGNGPITAIQKELDNTDHGLTALKNGITKFEKHCAKCQTSFDDRITHLEEDRH